MMGHWAWTHDSTCVSAAYTLQRHGSIQSTVVPLNPFVYFDQKHTFSFLHVQNYPHKDTTVIVAFSISFKWIAEYSRNKCIRKECFAIQGSFKDKADSELRFSLEKAHQRALIWPGQETRCWNKCCHGLWLL